MIVVKLKLYQEKVHSVRYNEVVENEDTESSVPSVYIKKPALISEFGRFPTNLELTIAEKE